VDIIKSVKLDVLFWLGWGKITILKRVAITREPLPKKFEKKFISEKNQGLYTQHFIFLVTFEWIQ
jgi:hypothetical protein